MNAHLAKDLSVILITRNEERNIVECLKSVSWAGEIIVVDSQSTDGTRSLARQFTDKVYTRCWEGYAAAKNYALEKTSGQWIFWIDADERVTPLLAEEILQAIGSSPPEVSGYQVARRAYFLGKWIKHSGWYPGYTLRLFRRDKVRFTDSRVHEKAEAEGTVVRLRHDLLHYTDDTLFHYFSKFNRYTTLAAEDLMQGGRKFSLYDLVVRPPFIFVKMYFMRLGFLDGMHGFVLSLLSAAYVFCKYAKLWDTSKVQAKEPS